MIKERPILYSTDMVLAILGDRKTKTRRLTGLEMVNEFPDLFEFIQVHYLFGEENPDAVYATFSLEKLGIEKINYILEKYNFKTPTIKCPYGKPGDVLWVRETFSKVVHSAYRQSNGVIQMPIDDTYVAVFKAGWDRSAPYWKPSIHMPKAASRIWLEITDIKVERLQDISEEDAIAEGVRRQNVNNLVHYYFYPCKDIRDNSYIPNIKPLRGILQGFASAAQLSFTSLWASINGWDSWHANPWVWVISFKVLSTTGKPEHLEAESSRLEAS